MVCRNICGLYREGTDYYHTPRAQHPNSPNWFLLKSVDQIAEYSSYDHVDMIASTNMDICHILTIYTYIFDIIIKKT
jgi:hypothetical protein